MTPVIPLRRAASVSTRHRGGDRSRLGRLVDGEQGRQRRRQQLVRRARSDDRGDAALLEQAPDRWRVRVGDHDHVPEEGEPVRIVGEFVPLRGVDDDESGEQAVGRSAEGLESDDRVHMPGTRHAAMQQLALEVPRHGGDITSHASIIQSVNE